MSLPPTEFPTTWPESGIVQLPESVAVAQAVLAQAEPLRSDPAFRKAFFGQMGIRHGDARLIAPINENAAYLWDETIQPSGSYKSCGASFATLMLPEGTTGIATFSTGNHGTSVAIAGSRRGLPVRVATPASIIPPKKDCLRAAGAEVLTKDPRTDRDHQTFREAEDTARYLQTQGLALIEPFGNLDVVAGQCKVGLEMVEQLIELDLADKTVVIPVSMAGGGHISGIAIPVWEAKQQGRLGPNIHVVGVQPERTNALDRALTKLGLGEAAINLFGAEGPDMACDALAITEASLSPMTAAIVNDPNFVSARYTVDNVTIGRALIALEETLGHPVEAAAALPYALAMLHEGQPLTFVLPVSGRNYSPEALANYKRLVRVDDSRQRQIAHAAANVTADARRAAFENFSLAYLNRRRHGLDEAVRSRTPGSSRRSGHI